MLHGIRVVLVGILGVSTTSVCYPALQVSPAVTRLTVYRRLYIFVVFVYILLLYSNSLYYFWAGI